MLAYWVIRKTRQKATVNDLLICITAFRSKQCPQLSILAIETIPFTLSPQTLVFNYPANITLLMQAVSTVSMSLHIDILRGHLLFAQMVQRCFSVYKKQVLKVCGGPG